MTMQTTDLHFWEREAEYEAMADALLKTLPRDPSCPTYTERQLSERGEDYCVASTEALMEMLMETRPLQSQLDEVKFLASLTRLTRSERACLRGWMLGWTQTEISAAWQEQCGRSLGVSRCLQSALRKCYLVSDLSFTEYSRRVIYRRPVRKREGYRACICIYCQEEYPWGQGYGRYCSLSCREARRHG